MKRNKFHDERLVAERERIALQIQAVVVPYRDPLVTDDPAVCDGYQSRARSLLDGLDTAVVPFPDLRASLSAARAELELGCAPTAPVQPASAHLSSGGRR